VRTTEEQMDALGREVEAALAEAKEITGITRTAFGRVRQLWTLGTGEANVAVRGLKELAARTGGERGTLARARSDSALRREIRTLRASVDSLSGLMASDRGTLGRFRKDSSLLLQIGGLRARGDSVRAMLGALSARASTMQGDSAMARELARTRVLLDSLTLDVKKHPFRYLNWGSF
jgi:hypothetical protein